MSVVGELIRIENDGAISFGNHELEEKAKVVDFPYREDLYKVKTYKAFTKVEKNGMLIYESVPGTSVTQFKETASGVEFQVRGKTNTQITVELEAEVEYEVYKNDISLGNMLTNLSGKLSISLEISEAETVVIKIVK